MVEMERPLLVADAGEITARRIAANSAVALLSLLPAWPIALCATDDGVDDICLGIFGTGEQAVRHAKVFTLEPRDGV